MQMKRNLILGAALTMAAAVPAISAADSVKLYRDDVIPVVMQTELNFKSTVEGDHFRARVSDSHMLPEGSTLEGIVNRVEQKHGNKPAFMDIEFTTIILPDGNRTNFHGTPIALSKNYVTQDKYGRWEAKKGVKKETVVLGAAAGGLILGALIKKPFEGAFLGVLAGIIAGETAKDEVGDGDIVVPKGSKVGARVGEDLAIKFDGRWDNGLKSSDGAYDREGYNSAGYDKYGYDRNGRYDGKYDSTRGSERDSDRGANEAGYDKYGYDKDGRYNAKYDTTREARDSNRDTYGSAKGRDLQIEIDRKAMHYRDDERPFRDGWILMVPLRTTAEQLGYTVNRDSSEGTIRIENESDVLSVEQNSKGYALNNRRGTFSKSVEVRDGVAYVPIDAFTMLTKGSVYVNGTKYGPKT
jgi:hypothetical protein